MQRRWDKSKPPSGPFTLNKDCLQAQGLVSWWPMGGAASANFVPDLVGNTHLAPGTAHTLALGNSGEPVSSFASASTQYLISSVHAITAYPFSASCWYKPASLGNMCLVNFGNAASVNNYWTMAITPTGTLRAQITDTNFANIAETTATSGIGIWANGINTFTSSTLRTVYLNGANAVSNTTANNFPSTLTNTSIGALSRTSVILPFNGQIGESAIWNVVLTAEQIAAINDPGKRFELWYPLRSRKWFTIGGSNLSLSGASITSAAGSLNSSFSKTMAGQSATASAGSVIPLLSMTLSGSALTALTGTLANTRSVTLTGDALSAALGTLGVLGVYGANLTGSSMTSQQGAFAKGLTTSINGLDATSSAGSLAPVINALSSGQAATSAAGTLSSTFNVVLTGDIGTTQAGNMHPILGGFTVLSGLSIGTSLGAFDITRSTALLGSIADAVEGSLVTQLSQAAIGSLASISLGDLSVAVEGVLSGNGLSLTQGSMVVSLSTSIAGIATTLYLGTLGDGRDAIEWVLVEAQSNTIIATSQSSSVLVAQQSQQFMIEALPDKVIN